ncbi:MAG: Holliday junction resolvase RuvX [Pseudomonadota bacterium]|jgi:putative Holliday junction resolvase
MPSAGPGPATWLAFDFGKVRIGVAIGNSLTGGARPLTVLSSVPTAQRFVAIAALIAEWQPDQLLVGLPVYPDGAAHPFAVDCQRFARQLHGRFGIPVTLFDERYTSALVPDRGQQTDAQAAAILLQGFLHAAIDSA